MSHGHKYKQSPIYQPCKHIKRETPDMTVNQEVAKEIGTNYNILPLYQKTLFDLAYQNHYSLQTNELLKCRWAQYKNNVEKKVFSPFEFVDIRDFHFHNCRNQLLPSESIHTRTNFRMSLKPGPSVDDRGLRPTPQELLMKRADSKGRKKQVKKEVKKEKDKK